MNLGFINDSLTNSFNSYLDNQGKEDSLEYNNFFTCVIRILYIIYGSKIIDSFKNNNVKEFENIIMSYGLDIKQYKDFVINFEKCYRFNIKQEDKAIKKKNRYFNLVQKCLIDMLVLKNKNDTVSKEEKDEFYSLLFTANTKDFYKKSVALVSAYNPYEIDEYFKKQNLI